MVLVTKTFLHSFDFCIERLALPSLLPSFSLGILGRHLLNQPSLVSVFFSTTLVSPVFRIAYITPQGLLVLLHPSSALPAPSLPSHLWALVLRMEATVSLRRRVMRLWLLVTRCPDPSSALLLLSLRRLQCFLSPSSPSPSPLPFPFAQLSLPSFPFLFPSPFPPSRPCPDSPIGTTSSDRRRLLRPKLLVTCKPHLLSTEMMLPSD